MRLVKDPDVYGQAAQVGVFIPMAEFVMLNGFSKLKKEAQRALKRAEKYREYFQGLQDSGEATPRQQTSLERWNEKAETAERIIQSIESAERAYENKTKTAH